MPNENTLPTPETRREMFLAAAAGESIDKPEPITREEMFLNAIGGGGSGDSYTKAETDALLDGKADLVDGKVPASELPSYVDDTIEGYYYEGAFYEDSEHTTAITGEAGKIYIDLTANKSYRWTGTVYVRIDECPAFGETQGTIYEGNKGKQNADNIGTMSSLTTTDKSSLVAAINELDSDKVDAVSGKMLSSNDFTDGDKTKLSGIAAGAEVNVQSDWSQSDNTADDYIKNKPTLTTSSTAPTSTGWYTARNNSGTVQYYAKFYSNATTSDAGLMSSTDKSKIDLCPSVTKTQSTFTSSTSIEDTGISVPVSADSITRVTGYLVYFSNKPTEIQLRQVYNGTESMLAYAIPDAYDSFSTARHNLSVSAIVTKNSTVKLYAKYDGISSNIGGIVKEVF